MEITSTVKTPAGTKILINQKCWLEKISNRKSVDKRTGRREKTSNLRTRELEYFWIFFKWDAFFTIWRYVLFGVYYIWHNFQATFFFTIQHYVHSVFVTFDMISSRRFLLFTVLFCHCLPFDVLSFRCFFLFNVFFRWPLLPFDVLSVDVFYLRRFYFDVLNIIKLRILASLKPISHPAVVFNRPFSLIFNEY